MATFQERDGRVRAIIRRKGHPTQTKTFERKSDAVKWARKVESEFDHGITAQSKVTVASIMERYRDEVVANKDGWREETIRINRLLKTSWAQRPVSDCSIAISDWVEKRRVETSDATANREMNVISAIFTHAIKRWRLALRENPIRRVARPPKTKARNRRVKAHEFQKIMGVEAKPGTLRWYIPPMFEFAIETGLRLGEMCDLEWQHVHEEEGWLHVAESKNGDSREVPMSDRAMEILRGMPRHLENVFPVNAGSFGTVYREECKALKIIDLHFHDTRHEAVSRLAKIFPLMQLAAVIGHRDLESLKVYYNPTIQELSQHLRGAGQSTSLRL